MWFLTDEVGDVEGTVGIWAVLALAVPIAEVGLVFAANVATGLAGGLAARCGVVATVLAVQD